MGRAAIDDALGLLASCEWVIGPAEDGGYYLIGCRASAFDVSVFPAMNWGSSEVLPATLDRIRAAQSSIALMPSRYDIDTLEDLERYASEGNEGVLGSLLASR